MKLRENEKSLNESMLQLLFTTSRTFSTSSKNLQVFQRGESCLMTLTSAWYTFMEFADKCKKLYIAWKLFISKNNNLDNIKKEMGKRYNQVLSKI